MAVSDDGRDNFGDPDGALDMARGEEHFSNLFVNTQAIRSFLERDPEYHVIVGSKGTGKSLLLFRKKLHIIKNRSVLFAPSSPRTVFTPTLKYAASGKWVPHWPLTDKHGAALHEQWGQLWHWALLVTTLSLWRQHNDQLTSRIDELLQDWRDDNPFDLVAGYLSRLEAGHERVRGQFVLPDPGDLHRFMLENVHDLPPTYLFLDNQDEHFVENPDFWTASGFGAFRAMRTIHRESNGRIHIFLTLRPEVTWEMQRSAHFPQWSSDFFYLHWTDRELLELFAARASRLKRSLLASPDASDPLGQFLGEDLYDPDRRQYMMTVPLVAPKKASSVRAADYLLRHTLRRPREIVILGNAIIERRAIDENRDSVEVIRHAVDEAASRVIAKPYLGEIKHRWPWNDLPRGGVESFILQYIRTNVLSKGEIAEIERAFAQCLSLDPQETAPVHRLAACGLIGWPVQDSRNGKAQIQKFVVPGEEDVLAIPGDVQWYLVHPILYGPPFHVQVEPGNLIGPGLRFREPQFDARYRSCFISYGSPDEAIAGGLWRALRFRRVECYLYCEDSKPGEPVWKSIGKELRSKNRMLVICSARSLAREGMRKEISRQVDEDPNKIIPLSLNDDWRQPDFSIEWEGRDLKPYLADTNGVDLSRRGDERAVNAILGALQKPKRSNARGASRDETRGRHSDRR